VIPKFERNGGRLTVHGPKGSFTFPNDFGTGSAAAHPFDGPGGETWDEVALYTLNDEIHVEQRYMQDVYGMAATNAAYVYVSRDGGLTYRNDYRADVATPSGRVFIEEIDFRK
jgi:hypothetical protein